MKLSKPQLRFLRRLSKHLLPMPQNYKEWYAAKIYLDHKKKSIYDVEQWTDYLKLKNKFPDDVFISGKTQLNKVRYQLCYILR